MLLFARNGMGYVEETHFMKTPMELLKDFAPEFAKNQMDERTLLFEHPNYQAVPAKYKLLIGIAAAAIAGSNTYTQI